MKLVSDLIEEQLNRLPNSPGVYLLRDTEGTILYVGKAANLRHRVRSYFGAGQKLSPKLLKMVAGVGDIDFYVTGSEQEALILELNLIKRHHPRYNVRLKDDKTFPYLKINTKEDWPRVHVTRRMEPDGSRYFGPFASAKSVRQTLKVVKGIFPFRNCTRNITGTDSRACLEYHMGRCLGPCIGVVSREEYAEVVKEVILFLEGKQERIVKGLQDKMDKAAEALDFEKAALYRDQVQAINEVIEGQRIAATVRGEQDVVAFAQERDQAYVQVFFIRNNKLTGRESFVLQGTQHEEPHQIMTSFIKQFYNSSPNIPPLLLLQYPVEDMAVLKDWLQSRRGARVDIQVPRRGNKKQLVDIVAENARQGLEQLKIKQLATPKELEAALAEIERELHLPQRPLRMEAYDISDIQGKAAVGSMVVFERGKSKPGHYRRFKIKTVAGADDYAMLNEVLKRRFKHLGQETSTPDTWAMIPDLVLIDGGRGQLNAALSAMGEVGVTSVPVASLAKENEEIFIPKKAKPIVLPRRSPGLQLLQRLRDEAHRFALGYYQKVRRRETFTSVFDGMTGIGPKRKRALLKQFGSVQAIREASVEEIAATRGMTESLARKVKELL
ncbi:MAG TPA: excinuclease ABC subunit UvrC [Dehalococcoidales bacterium]|nr:excinuclease ABC subunit UvrC [Dehalococcoidales bacterium]